MAKKSSKTGSTKKKKKELKPAGNKIFHVGIYDEQHRKNLQQRAKKVQQLYKQAVDKITKAAQPTLFGADPNLSEFHFSDFPTLNKAVDKYIQQMGAGLQSNIEQGDTEAWKLSNTKNDAMVDYLAGTYSIPKETLKEWKHPHLEALESFMERKTKGMNLSNGGSETSKLVGVWNLDQFKNELELALELGIGKGKSAAELSKDVRQYLKYPNKLFRRVRDKSGALRLSKAAAAFHPGRGVYRSSYRNALRLTATENNIAYRTCDHKRWQALDFVLGQEIRLSNNHTLNGKPFTDICDELAGKYPKEFKFTGWHPWCRCYSVSILADRAEVDEYCKLIAEGKSVANFKFTGALTLDDMPKEFKEWVAKNKKRIKAASSMPYFLKDNPELLEKAGYKITKKQHDLFDWKNAEKIAEEVKIAKKAVSKETKPAESKLHEVTPVEIGAARHAARTKEVIKAIQAAWDAKRMGDIETRAKEAEKVLAKTTSSNNKRTALKKRLQNVKKAIRTHKSPAAVGKLYARYQQGIDIQQRWDKLLWEGFSKEQKKNCEELEKKIGTLKRRRMSVESADIQKANPNFDKAEQYQINCATCSPTYVLREWGFNIKARGRKETAHNNKIAFGRSFDVWYQPNGRIAPHTTYREWMDDHKYKEMTEKRYKEFFNDNTKEEGTYIVTIGWKGGGGHATILKRKHDGSLVYIEPQHYIKSQGMERKVNDLYFWGKAKYDYGERGIMRVDNKIFDVKWADIFDKY